MICVRYIANFNINAETKSGKPSAFSYFTQIIHFAFIRRLQKEKKQVFIKEKFKSEANLSEFADALEARARIAERSGDVSEAAKDLMEAEGKRRRAV